MSITKERLRQAIDQKYIQPTKRKRTPRVGVEFEFPIVNLKKQPVDFAVVHQMTDAFIRRFSFDTMQRDDDGEICFAKCTQNQDVLSYECSYNTLEFSFGAEVDLHTVQKRFSAYYAFIQEFLAPFHHTLTGMGINPYHRFNRDVPIANGRYRMLFHHLSTYRQYGNVIPFHDQPNYGLFACASQVQLDVEESQIVETLNTFSRLEPLKSLLFANSVWGEGEELLCSRDHFWKNSMQGFNPRNVDMYDTPFTSVEEVVDYILSMSMYCVEREGKYLNFPPIPMAEYFAASEITGEYFDGNGYRELRFMPRLEDLDYLRSFKLEDLTFRGTVEFRSVCAQPVGEVFAPAAFHAGLLKNLPELTALLEQDKVFYQHGYDASALRELCNHRELPSFLDREKASALLLEILDLAKDGLVKRGFGEEVFLEPLYSRAKYLFSPGRQMVEGMESGVSLEHYIEEYAKL